MTCRIRSSIIGRPVALCLRTPLSFRVSLGVLAAGVVIAGGLVIVALPAVAGPNAGGTIIVHGYPGVIPTPPDDFCGYQPIDACEAANVRFDDTGQHAWTVYAAFPPGASPRLKGVVFGVDYPGLDIVAVYTGPCAEFELPDADWPAPGTGTSLVFTETQTDPLVQLCWFWGYDYYTEPAVFSLTPHSTQGGLFADDSIPSITDEIVGYGSLGFFTDGQLTCPPDHPVVGACCLDSGECALLTQEACDAECGVFVGPGYPCDPNPCPGVPWGACCFPGGICELRGLYYCECMGGDWVGELTDCDPNPCGPVPIEETSWGEIKNRYR